MQTKPFISPARPFGAMASQRRRLSAALLAALAGLVLSACGGGNQGAGGAAGSLASTEGMGPTELSATAPAAFMPRQATTLATAPNDPGLLLLLVPDGQNLADPRISAWADAASEEGVRLLPVTDSQFIQWGAATSGFAGLILPDSLHTRADDTLIDAIRGHTQRGGRTLLVFDFGALLPSGFYPATGPSRLSDLAGVQYLMYDTLRDRTSGLGPVRAARSTLRQLLVPPGKSLDAGAITASVAPSAGLQKAGDGSAASALYLPVSPQDPGGAQGFDPQQYLDLRYTTPRVAMGAAPRTASVNLGRAQRAAPVGGVTRLPSERFGRQKAVLTTDPLDTYSGYLLGPLLYPVYVTQGDFAGPGQLPLADSPEFGLVAGVNPVGLGQVLFVNLPLTYLKGRTDALPMHGFLHYFTRNLLNLPHLSAMPNGVAGMTLDWHLDALAAQAPTQSLVSKGVFNAPGRIFSIEMTAGPDLEVAGDRLGWNLPANLTARKLLKTFDNFGHAVGSHGGWIHNFYGANASETNQFGSTQLACANALALADNFQQCLVLNRQAVDAATGHASRSYSAPEGNNPNWAMTALENQGVVAAYFGGHTGLGLTRQYRDGVLLNPKLWVAPVTPQGLYATFEEWQAYNVPKAEVSQWYRDLVDFEIAQNTSRMVYAHPPGADLWFDVLGGLLSYAGTQVSSGKLAWYSMPRLADFMSTRLQVSWTQTVNPATGVTRFDASHPVNLKEMVWRLPKSRYASAPVVVAGTATVVGSDPVYWLVKAVRGTSLSFTAL